MPGSKCKMLSELNGLHIQHEFRGKGKITSSCGGQDRPPWGRCACEPVLGPGGRAVMTADLGATPPEGWMKKCVLSKDILLKGSVCVLCLSYPAEVRAPCVQCLGGGYRV